MRRPGTLSLILSIASSSAIARIRRVEHEIGIGQQFQAVDEHRVVRLLRDVTSPEIPVADPAEERVLPVTIEVLLEFRLVGLQVADDADDDRVALRDLEHPEVVFDPRARLHLDCAHRCPAASPACDSDRDTRQSARRLRRGGRCRARPAGDWDRRGGCGRDQGGGEPMGRGQPLGARGRAARYDHRRRHRQPGTRQAGIQGVLRSLQEAPALPRDPLRESLGTRHRAGRPTTRCSSTA